MIKKITAIFSLLNLLFFVNPVLAIDSNSHATKKYDIPDSAVQISDNVYSLGKTKDPKTGKQVEGFAVVHYKNPEGKISGAARAKRSEEHTSELQSHVNLVCRLLLEKK